jgi:acyl carrier protein
MESLSSQIETSTVSGANATNAEIDVCKQRRTVAEIQEWIVSYLAELLEIESDDINVSIPFDRYGLDSAVVVGLTGDLEEWLGQKLDPTLLYDYPTIEAISQHLAQELSRDG